MANDVAKNTAYSYKMLQHIVTWRGEMSTTGKARGTGCGESHERMLRTHATTFTGTERYQVATRAES